MNILVRFEKWLEWLIEKPFAHVFHKHLHPADLTHALIEAFYANRWVDDRGRYLAPNAYQVTLNVDEFQRLLGTSSLEDEIVVIERYLGKLITESDCHIIGNIQVKIFKDPRLPPGKIKIQADHRISSTRTGNMTEPLSFVETRPIGPDVTNWPS